MLSRQTSIQLLLLVLQTVFKKLNNFSSTYNFNSKKQLWGKIFLYSLLSVQNKNDIALTGRSNQSTLCVYLPYCTGNNNLGQDFSLDVYGPSSIHVQRFGLIQPYMAMLFKQEKSKRSILSKRVRNRHNSVMFPFR